MVSLSGFPLMVSLSYFPLMVSLSNHERTCEKANQGEGTYTVTL
jgi:hypothetical protein